MAWPPPDNEIAAEDRHTERLRRYYEDTWFDYRLLWLDPRTRAMHFGYEQPGTRRHGDSLLALNHVMAEHVGLRSGEQVLDAGCGVGGTSLWLAENYGAKVVGINLVEDHVERARRYARDRQLGQDVAFEVADYTATGFAPASFDVVWAQESACHAPSKRALADEAFRLLRPGGRLVMAEYVIVDDDAEGRADDAEGRADDAEGRVDDPEHRRSNDADLRTWQESWEMTLASDKEWDDALTGAGLADVRSDDITAQVRRSLRRLYRLCRVLEPVARGLHLVRLRTETQQRNITGSLAMWRALQRGRWRYQIITAVRPAIASGRAGRTRDDPR
jgi:tocopherol O-methyltransferase